jgi:hypothetical protein
MPTRAGLDVVPLRKATKERLARLKGEGSYDAVITRLLDGEAPVPPSPEGERFRAPAKQVALAKLAAERWRLMVESGRIVDRAPRLLVYRLPEEPRRDVRVRWSGRRGFAP